MSKTKELSIGENIAWNSIGNLIYLIAQWALSYVVVRFLGYGLAGTFSLAMSIGNSLNAIATYSMRNYQVSDLKGDYSDSQYILSRVLTSGISFIVCIAFTGFNPYDAYTSLCIIIYMTFKISEAASDVYQGLLQRVGRMDYIGKAYILKSLVDLVLYCGILLFTRNLLLAICGLSAGSAAVVCLYERASVRQFSNSGNRDTGTKNNLKKALSLLVVCLPIALYGLFFNTMGQVPRYALEAMLGSDSLGIYTSVAMPVTLVQVSANYLFAPLTAPLAQCYIDKNTQRFYSIIKKVGLAIAVIAACAFAGFGILGRPVMRLLFGDSILPYLYLLYPLIVCSLLVAVSWFLSAALTVVRQLKGQLLMAFASFSISSCLSPLFISLYGMNGATFSYTIALFVFSVGSMLLLLKSFNPSVLHYSN